jgi:hypothetical protein
MGQSALAAAYASGRVQWGWDGWLVAMTLSAGLLTAASAVPGVRGARHAGVLVARLPWLARRPRRQARLGAMAVTRPLAELPQARTALPSTLEVYVALLRRAHARQGAALQWTPLIIVAVVAAVRRPDPDLLAALAVVFPVLGCLLMIDRVFDVRANRRDHVAERAADALGMALALGQEPGRGAGRATVPARLTRHTGRLCRALEREASGRHQRAAAAMTDRLVAQIRYSTDQGLAAVDDDERAREREHLVLVLASVLQRHTRRGPDDVLPVDAELIDDAAVAAMAPRPRDGLGWVLVGGLSVLVAACGLAWLAAWLGVPDLVQPVVPVGAMALGCHVLERCRIPVLSFAKPSSGDGPSG